MANVCSTEPHLWHKGSASPPFSREWDEAGTISLLLQKGLPASDREDCPTCDHVPTHPCSRYPSKWWAGDVVYVWADPAVLVCSQHVSPGSGLLHPPYQPQQSYFWRMTKHCPKLSLKQKVFRPCRHEPQRSKCTFKLTWVFIRNSLCCFSDLK